MKKHIILGLIPLITSPAFSADIRLINNSPFQNRGTVEKAQSDKTKTSLSLGISSFSNVETEIENTETSSMDTLVSLKHSLLNNLDLGISYIRSAESSRDNNTSITSENEANNVSLGLKYQFAQSRFIDAALSAYTESGYGEIETSTNSSKSKVGLNGLASIRPGKNFRINMQTGFKYYNNALYENYQLNGELQEAIGFESIYKSFRIEALVKARQLRTLDVQTAKQVNFNAFVYGANATADLDIASIQAFAEFSNGDYMGIADSSYGITIAKNLYDSSNRRAPETSRKFSN